MQKKQHPFNFTSLQIVYEQYDHVLEYISKYFFKSLITTLPVRQIVPHLQLVEWPVQSHIFNEGDKIDKYYFIVQGNVNLYKRTYREQKLTNSTAPTSNVALEIVQSKMAPTLIGQTFFSNNISRSYTAITDDTVHCRGFSLDKKIFQKYLMDLTRQYKVLKSYLCEYLSVTTDKFYKMDLYEHIDFHTSYYGQEIPAHDQIFIIYEGECMMSYLLDKNKPFRPSVNAPQSAQMVTDRSQRYERSSVPYKIDQSVHSSRKYYPLLKLCENECFGVEKLPCAEKRNPTDNQEQTTKPLFKYVVTSEKLIYLAIKHASIPLFPVEMRKKLKRALQSYQEKLQSNMIFRDKSQSSTNYANITDSAKGLSRSLSPKILSVSQQKHKQDIIQDELKSKMGHASKPKFKELTNVADSGKQSFCLPKVAKSRSKFVKLEKAEMNKKHNLTEIVSEGPQNKLITKKVDITEMRKIYCLGFDMKNKCNENGSMLLDCIKIKEQIKEPKGYFAFGSNRKVLKENLKKQQASQRSQSNQGQKSWAHYLKLPELINKKSAHLPVLCN